MKGVLFNKYKILALFILLCIPKMALCYNTIQPNKDSIKNNSVSVTEFKDGDIYIPAMNPNLDSMFFQKIRERFAQIRKHRPTVALVLSGGGAKGVAHVGVLKYIEKIGIPIDIVLGTSMGGLAAALYALGYTPAQMDSVVHNIDWESSLTDATPKQYMSYKQNRYSETYLLSFPFYYAKNNYDDNNFTNTINKQNFLHLGVDGEDSSTSFKNNLLSSLPFGFIYGQNVNNIISSLTVGYQDSTSFDKLPIPFLCVATEMVTSKAKNWHEGKINTALRSTMSIPGVYAPVKTDGMVLVDGGMRNNYPCDIAKKMGADIIIGVDLSSGYKNYKSLNNLADIIRQGVDMLGRSSYERNRNIPNVNIKPYLPEFNMMSFEKNSIDTIINRGYEAAVEQKDALLAVKKRIGTDTTILQGKPAVNLNTTPVLISDIQIKGISQQESRYLRRKLHLYGGHKYGVKDINNAVATIYGTKCFDYVNYELLGKKEPYKLIFNCKKGSINQFGLSVRVDTEEIVSILANLGINTHTLQGHSLDLIAKMGVNPYVEAHYYFNTSTLPTINFAVSGNWINNTKFSWGDVNYNIAYFKHKEEAFLSNINMHNFDVKLGLSNNYYKLKSIMTDKVVGDYNKEDLTNSYVSTFINFIENNLDQGYFPTKGWNTYFNYSFTFAGLMNKIAPFHTFEFGVKTAFTIKEKFTVLPRLNARMLLGENIPISYVNLIGGNLKGRFLEQQIPFIGISGASTTDNILFVGGINFRYRLYKNNYISTIVNIAHSFYNFQDLILSDNSFDFVGAGLEYSYDSIFGPIKANVHWSNVLKGVGAYLSVGFDF